MKRVGFGLHDGGKSEGLGSLASYRVSGIAYIISSIHKAPLLDTYSVTPYTREKSTRARQISKIC